MSRPMTDRPLDGIALRGRRQLDQERLQARHALQERERLYADVIIFGIGVFGAVVVAHGVARWLGWI